MVAIIMFQYSQRKKAKKEKKFSPEETTPSEEAMSAGILLALMKEHDHLGTVPSTREVTRRRDELSRKIDEARKHVAKKRIESGIKISSESTGLLDQHEEIMMTFARANDVVMIWRPVNPQAAEKLEGWYRDDGKLVGQYKGKALNTKGKSSLYPAISADIPFDVRLSKVSSKDFDKFQKKNKDTIQFSKQQLENYQKQFNLLKTQQDYEKLKELIDEANEEKIVVPINKCTPDGEVIYYIVHNEDDSIYKDENDFPVFVMQKEH